MEQSQEHTPRNKNRGLMKLGFGIVAGVLVIIIGLMIFGGDKKKQVDVVSSYDSTAITASDSTELDADTDPEIVDVPPQPTITQSGGTYSVFGLSSGYNGPQPTAAQVESLARMNPRNLLEMIQKKGSERKLWEFQMKGFQGSIEALTSAWNDAASTSNLGPLGDMQLEYYPPAIEPKDQESYNELLGEMRDDIRDMKRELLEHRDGARASHATAVRERKQIQNKVDNLASEIVAAKNAWQQAAKKLNSSYEKLDDSELQNATAIVAALRLKYENLTKATLLAKN